MQSTEHGSIQLNTKVVSIEPTADGIAVTSKTPGQSEQTEVFDVVISGLPSDVLASTLPSSNTDTPLVKVAKLLKGINRASAGVINLGYRSNVLKDRSGFGYLVPSNQVR